MKRKALKSICKNKVAALGFDKRGNILGIMFNKPRFSRKGGGIHAEINLISRYGTNIKTILILRINTSGNVQPIDPCPVCDSVCRKLGIKIRSIR